MTKNLQEFINKYHSYNFPIFPVKMAELPTGKTEKKPMVVGWERITLEISKKINFNSNGIGVPTGDKIGAFVLDLDIGSEEFMKGKELPPTVCQRTGSGGMHYFFKMIPGVRNSASIISQNVDIRGDGGYVVLPGSWHAKGEYEWVLSPDDIEIAEAPDWLKIELEKIKVRKPHDIKLAYGAPEGKRNESAAKVIGYILNKIDKNYWEDFGWVGLKEWNKRNSPPMPEDELRKVFISIASRQYAQRYK